MKRILLHLLTPAFGPKRTFQVHAVMSAIGGKADSRPQSQNVRF